MLYKINEYGYCDIPDYSYFTDNDNEFKVIEDNENEDIKEETNWQDIGYTIGQIYKDMEEGFKKAFGDFGKTLENNTIDDIEELKTVEVNEHGFTYKGAKQIATLLNQLVQALKQLNKEIKELKEEK